MLSPNKSSCLRTDRGGGGGHSNTVVHMRDQRNAKKGLFFETEPDSQDSRLGVKIYLFSRKGVLFNSIRGRLGVFHQTYAKKKLINK